MNSHILIPKCILKNFEDNKQSLHCYDVKHNKYCLCRSKNLNTEENHYSKDVEKFLSDKIETPIGDVIKKLEIFFNSKEFIITFSEYKSIKCYVYSLISRSYEMKKEIYNGLIFKDWFTPQAINDIAATQSFEMAGQEDFLKDFNMTFIFLHGAEEFVLPLQGHCDFSAKKRTFCVVPLSPKIAVYFYSGQNIGNKIIQGEIEFCNKINELSLKAQKQKKYGYVISRNEKIIKDLIVNM